MDGGAFVEARGLARYFDVSKPWLNRVLEHQPRLLLKAVDGVDFAIRKGETLSLVGESGCGKSTVARLVVGLYRPTKGQVLFAGADMAVKASRAEQAAVRKRFQMIFQDPYASLNPRWRVADIVAEPIRAHRLLAGAAEIRKRVDELLRHVGLAPADGEKYPHEFSGGQRQRISIARALSSNPEFLVCDEPTSALDVSVQAQILNLLKRLQRELGLAYLFITHNLAVVEYLADEIAVMYLGRIVERGTVGEVLGAPQHPYTQALLSAVPTLEGGVERVQVTGELPSPSAPPSGCHFHPRCPHAMARCRREYPSAVPRSQTHAVNCFLAEEAR
jgi:peptide/nickel transport system ATP-binding protein